MSDFTPDPSISFDGGPPLPVDGRVSLEKAAKEAGATVCIWLGYQFADPPPIDYTAMREAGERAERKHAEEVASTIADGVANMVKIIVDADRQGAQRRVRRRMMIAVLLAFAAGLLIGALL